MLRSPTDRCFGRLQLKFADSLDGDLTTTDEFWVLVDAGEQVEKELRHGEPKTKKTEFR
jgi:hypothetical protein